MNLGDEAKPWLEPHILSTSFHPPGLRHLHCRWVKKFEERRRQLAESGAAPTPDRSASTKLPGADLVTKVVTFFSSLSERLQTGLRQAQENKKTGEAEAAAAEGVSGNSETDPSSSASPTEKPKLSNELIIKACVQMAQLIAGLVALILWPAGMQPGGLYVFRCVCVCVVFVRVRLCV